jgi:hypothetical protein
MGEETSSKSDGSTSLPDDMSQGAYASRQTTVPLQPWQFYRGLDDTAEKFRYCSKGF